jgi:hypothetical protein
MKLTGENLLLVHYAMGLAVDEVHNEIAMCPDREAYANEIASCEAELGRLEKLRDRIGNAVTREEAKLSAS